ncbi:MAG: hypothetical protein NTY22_06835 [Proteobacteria bacterium]|nr:hypothetical protein [Pseudomonadota bacterium]
MKNFRESLADIFRHHLTSLLFCGVIAVTILILCIFGSVIYNLDSIEKKWSYEVRIMVFTSDTSDPKIIAEQIKKIKNVINVTNIEPIAVAELIKKRFPDQNITISETVLPSIIEVRVGIKDIDGIKKEISKIPEVEEITVNTSWFDSLKKLTSSIEYVALIVSGLIFFMSMLLISYVTKLGVVLRKPEISIMRFCGATEWYIRKPYVLSGIVLGFIGGGIGILFYFGLSYFMRNMIGNFVDTWKTGTPIQILIIYGLAMFLGASGNFMAFSRGEEDE